MLKTKNIAKFYFVSDVSLLFYSGLNLNQDKATKPQTVQIVRQGEATPYWFKFNPLYILLDVQTAYNLSTIVSKDVSMAERSQQQLNPNRGFTLQCTPISPSHLLRNNEA